MNNLVYQKEYSVHSYESDTNGGLSITSLFNFLQDIASSHASVLHFGKEDLDRQNRLWVLSRIVCNIQKLPLWDDTLTIRTWPRGIDKLFAIRDFEICDSNDKRIGTAISYWIILDSQTRRPQRPDNLLSKYKKELPGLGSDYRSPEKLPPPGENIYNSEIQKIKYSDLDVNMHVNNAKYLQWVTDSYPLDFIQKNWATAVEINYLAETVPGDEIIITAEEKDDSFYHSVIKKGSGKEACRIRIKWQTCRDTKVY